MSGQDRKRTQNKGGEAVTTKGPIQIALRQSAEGGGRKTFRKNDSKVPSFECVFFFEDEDEQK